MQSMVTKPMWLKAEEEIVQLSLRLPRLALFAPTIAALNLPHPCAELAICMIDHVHAVDKKQVANRSTPGTTHSRFIEAFFQEQITFPTQLICIQQYASFILLGIINTNTTATAIQSQKKIRKFSRRTQKVETNLRSLD